MFTAISQWFGVRPRSEKPSAAALRAERKHSSISYSPQLVPSLVKDHGELLKMFTGIEAELAAGHYDDLPKLLGAFKTKLDVHLLNENLRFYCYLEQSLSASPHELEIMKGFRREMNDIARGVVNFVRKWQTAGVAPASCRNFLEEYRRVGELLTQRMSREEDGLYSLYIAPGES